MLIASMDATQLRQGLRASSDKSHWILQAPIDILLQITDHLELHERFVLSQTCRAWRAVTIRDWPVQLDRLDMKDQVNFWAGMAYTWPRYWACAECAEVVLSPDYDPGNKVRYIHHVREKPPREVPLSMRTALADLEHAHVQFALKYSRLFSRLEPSQRQYFEDLMSPTPPAESDPSSPLGESRRTEFKIIQGHFLLHQETSVLCDADAGEPQPPDISLLELLEFTFVSFNICPHELWWEDPPIPPSVVEAALGPNVKPNDMLGRMLKAKPERKIQRGCEICLTGYEVCLVDGAEGSSSSATVFLRTWSDLGQEVPLIDTRRTALEDLEESFDDVPRFLPREEILFSVRDMWLGDE